MSKKVTKTRRYCFTIHNYTEKDLEHFHDLAKSLERHRYICYGLEIAPDTGTKHIQGYIELNDAQRFTFLHNYFNFTRDGELIKFHIETANGTAEDNRKYVSKDGDFYEFGEPSSQGSRNDLHEIKKAVKEDPRKMHDIIEDFGNNLQQVKFAQALQPYYLPERDPNNPPKVFWIYGPTGIGKTRLVYESFDDICSVSSYDWLGTGYNQNECFLLDDFREFSLPFEQILKLTDRYPYTLFFKGSQIPLNSPYIVFTSPESVDKTFGGMGEDLQQLHRRLTEINLASVEDISKINLKDLDDLDTF